MMETNKKTYCFCAQVKLDINMQADGYNQTGCFNSNCPGFVQVNRDKGYALGSVISPPNSIGSTQKLFAIFLIIQVKNLLCHITP